MTTSEYTPIFTDNELNTEEWRAIQNYPYYQVSNLGRVRCFKKGGRKRIIVETPKILKPRAHITNGRLYVQLYNEKGAKTFRIATLVLTAFIGLCPSGMEACHGENGHTDNRLSNLRWDTHANNMVDAVNRGEMSHGENHLSAKLTDAQVVEIRTRFNNGERGTDLAVAYQVGKSAIQGIVYGKSRKHAGGIIQTNYRHIFKKR